MKDSNIRKLILASIFSAMTFCLTFIIQIPVPISGGYINLGECMVLVSGFVLGPVFGSLSAGIGCALADIISGYTVYAAPTFIIKFLVAMTTALAFKRFNKNLFHIILCAFFGEIVMVLGYFIFEAYILGFGWLSGLISASLNAVQALAGIIASTLLLQAFMHKNKKSGKNSIL
jgi:uncharacterized membrane protein